MQNWLSCQMNDKQNMCLNICRDNLNAQSCREEIACVQRKWTHPLRIKYTSIYRYMQHLPEFKHMDYINKTALTCLQFYKTLLGFCLFIQF